ncbi:MAG: TIGR04454 family lipoprotein [Leptospiraceae bacterium]|nr:TIGR04454 family lipoprotein [Leptospiraceae bacterium]MCP5502323.1 TIGR04454 family lipoprotein [Leptospiraceae bacterium]
MKKQIAVIALTLSFALVNCNKESKTSAECKPALDKVFAAIESSIPEEQKAQFATLKTQAEPGLMDACKNGKMDLECMNNAKDLQAMLTCKK